MSRTILIVDDNPEERGIFSAYLHFVGGRLLEAEDGAAGLATAREHRPDLILLDLKMPVMDGWEMIRHLREDPGLSAVPVVAITGHHLPWERLAEAGFRGYVEKPLSPHEVLMEVERCLGRIDELPEEPEAAELAAGGFTRRVGPAVPGDRLTPPLTEPAIEAEPVAPVREPTSAAAMEAPPAEPGRLAARPLDERRESAPPEEAPPVELPAPPGSSGPGTGPTGA